MSAISEMVAVDDRLHLVTEEAIYRIELADHVDPARSNAAIPNSQQQVLNVGAANPIVGKILLTGTNTGCPSFDTASWILASTLAVEIAARCESGLSY